MCLLGQALRYIIPFSLAGRRAVCDEPGDGTVLAEQPVTDGRHPSVDDVGVAADAGEIRRRYVREARVRRRYVELMSLLLQSQLLGERQGLVHRSLTQPHRVYNGIGVHFYPRKQ